MAHIASRGTRFAIQFGSEPRGKRNATTGEEEPCQFRREELRRMPTVTPRREIVVYLKKRRDELTVWLKKEDPACFTEQKHLDQGTGERIYWHYGYLSAIKDALRLLS
jgi:hypothetical protein